MAKKVEILKQYTHYKNKRIRFLFFLLLWILVTLCTFLILNLFFEFYDTSFLVLFFQLILFMLWFYHYMPISRYQNMQFSYYSMLLDAVSEMKSGILSHPQSIIDFINLKGFKIQIDRSGYSIYSMIADKKSLYIKQGLIFVVIIKDNDISFFSEDLEADMTKIKEIKEFKYYANKESIIQIRSYKTLNLDDKEKLNQIICFDVNKQTIVHVNVGFDITNNKYYVLRPIKRFPNKYYYNVIKLIDEMYKGDQNEKNENKK